MKNKNIIQAIKNSFPDHIVQKILLFKKGHVNKTYKITLDNKKELILRIYEKDDWKAIKEKYIYKLIRKNTQINVPNIYNIDGSKKIIPKIYSIFSYIPGIELEKAYLINKNKELVKEAAVILKQLHSIKFDRFGWIVGEEINPKFRKWHDFVLYDVDNKLNALKNKIPQKLASDVRIFFEYNESLLNIKEKPCLIHKDYHSSHIIAEKDKINGIIDVEWAIAGHSELDFVKLEMWFLDRYPETKEIFYNAYSRLSSGFEERKPLYKLLTHVGMLKFAKDMKDKSRFDYSLKSIQDLIKNENR